MVRAASARLAGRGLSGHEGDAVVKLDIATSATTLAWSATAESGAAPGASSRSESLAVGASRQYRLRGGAHLDHFRCGVWVEVETSGSRMMWVSTRAGTDKAATKLRSFSQRRPQIRSLTTQLRSLSAATVTSCAPAFLICCRAVVRPDGAGEGLSVSGPGSVTNRIEAQRRARDQAAATSGPGATSALTTNARE